MHLKEQIEKQIDECEDVDAKIALINQLKELLHKKSPFSEEPVDCVIWVKSADVQANDYNPNSVAPPEMKLLQLSIESDGYTQPVVAWDRDTHLEVVDGFHRTRVAKECESVRNRVHGYIPVAVVKNDRTDRNDRIASTIRHNRARGKHAVSSMSDIVVELKRRNWSDTKIAKELGMDADEVLRLSQISGLAEMFSDRAFTEAWEAEDPLNVEPEIDMD
jgi:ParB-like chromosome segregation protein Spo0J